MQFALFRCSSFQSQSSVTGMSAGKLHHKANQISKVIITVLPKSGSSAISVKIAASNRVTKSYSTTSFAGKFLYL
jgi:hypothetical protein